MVRDPAIGARIRQVRRSLKLTQQEFGRELGLTKVSVARYEAGRVPRLDLLRRISQLGGLTVGRLLQGQGGARIVGRDEVVLPKGTARRGPHNMLKRLAKQLASNPQWPPGHRKRYEKRGAEILSRAIRELREFRVSLDSTQITASERVGRQTEK
jgi:transcriptional regulator with XRE-family HTH domain